MARDLAFKGIKMGGNFRLLVTTKTQRRHGSLIGRLRTLGSMHYNHKIHVKALSECNPVSSLSLYRNCGCTVSYLCVAMLSRQTKTSFAGHIGIAPNTLTNRGSWKGLRLVRKLSRCMVGKTLSSANPTRFLTLTSVEICLHRRMHRLRRLWDGLPREDGRRGCCDQAC